MDEVVGRHSSRRLQTPSKGLGVVLASIKRHRTPVVERWARQLFSRSLDKLARAGHTRYEDAFDGCCGILLSSLVSRAYEMATAPAVDDGHIASNLAEAIRYLEQASALAPRSWDILIDRAVFKVYMGRFPEALADVDLALALGLIPMESLASILHYRSQLVEKIAGRETQTQTHMPMESMESMESIPCSPISVSDESLQSQQHQHPQHLQHPQHPVYKSVTLPPLSRTGV